MTDYTYNKFNPTIVLTANGVPISEGLHMKIYNDDGTPYRIPEPTNKELEEFSKKILAVLPNIEMRILLYILQHIQDISEKAVLTTLGQIHDYAHHPEIIKVLDEELMCDGILEYTEESSMIESQEVTPDNVSSVLQKFFVNGMKPN